MAIKIILLTSVVVMSSIFADVPVHNFWFWSTLYVLFYHNFITAVIEGMVEPTGKSSDGYIWAYRTFHSLGRKATPYALHRSFWKFFEHSREDKKDE